MLFVNRKGKESLTLKEASDILANVKTPITYVFTPSNLEQERKKFFESDEYNPQFKYKLLSNNNEKIFNDLKDINRISDVDPRVSDFYIDLISAKMLVDKLYNATGNNDLVTKYSIERYGFPSHKLFRNATRLIKGFTTRYNLVDSSKFANSRKVSTDEMVSILKYFLDIFDLKDWNVVFSKRQYSKNIRVGVKDKEIVLGSDDVEKNALKLRKTIVHEIGTHVLRWYNGNLSGIPALSKSNLAGYNDAEEGLASFNEELMGLMDFNTLKQKALHAYAIYIGKDLSFRQLYNVLRAFVSKETAFKMTLRVKRGLSDTSLPGIYSKDVVYLRGFKSVKTAISKDNSVYEKLYAGKIGLKQISWVDDGLIPSPKVVFDKNMFNKEFRKLGI